MRDFRNIEAVLFDFSDVVATVRMALSADPGDSDYVIELNADVVDAVARLRVAGVATALVTNNDRDGFAHHAPHIRTGEMFDVDVFSSDLGISKPDPRIYRYALERLGVHADRAIFLDDVPRNVDAAISVGMKGVVVDRPATAVAVVDEILRSR